jgi:hypothetical protein
MQSQMNLDDALDDRVRHAFDLIGHEGEMAAFRTCKRRTLMEFIARISTIGVCAWSLFEIPWEISPADDFMQICALLVGELALIGIGLCALAQARFARVVFTFLCCASVLAVGSALPSEYAASPQFFGLSLVECLLKATVVTTYIFGFYLQRPILDR